MFIFELIGRTRGVWSDVSVRSGWGCHTHEASRTKGEGARVSRTGAVAARVVTWYKKERENDKQRNRVVGGTGRFLRR